MSFWLPQNLQKRLLLYAVQQVSVLSNVDLSNLHVSLGSSSQFTFDDLELAVDSMNVPGFEVKSGTIDHLDLQLTVSGGVGIKGRGLLFELKPKLSEQGSPFSLAKSIQDLTNSIIQLPDVSTEMSGPNDLPEGITASSSSASSSGEDDGAHTVGKLESMRNKLLNVALSQLTITFDDIKARLFLEDHTVIELSLGTIDFQTERTSLRRVSITDFRASQFKREDTKDEVHSDADDMAGSKLIQPHIEASSLYMSAMEDSKMDPSKAVEPKGEEPVLLDMILLDHLNITFEGLSSIDDLSVRNFAIKSKVLDLKLHNVLDLNDFVFELLIQAIQRYDQDGASQTTSLPGYKRFQKEQQATSEMLDLCSIELGQINVELSDIVSFSLKDVSLELHANGVQSFSVNAIELNGELMSPASASAPIIRGKLTSQELVIAVLHSTCLKLNIQILKTLTSTFRRTQEVFSLMVEKHVVKRHSKVRDHNQTKITVQSEPLSVSLILDNYILLMNTGPVTSDLTTNIFETKSIRIERHTSNEKNTLIDCREISIVGSRSKVQINSYDESFKDALLTSKFVCKVNEIIFEEDHKVLQSIFSDLSKLTDVFMEDSNEHKEASRKTSMKKSVRILQSSSVLYRHTELAAFALIIDSIEVTVRNFIKREFGSLQLTAGNILLAMTEDDGVISFCKKLSCRRVTSSTSEIFIEPIRLNNEERPLIFFYRKSGGKIKMRVKNLSFCYYAKWLWVLRTTETGAKSENTEEIISEQPWELKLIDCSIILRPSRLNAALAVVIDNLTCSAKSFKPQMKSIVKSGSLMLIDDFCNIKSPSERCWPSLPSLYAHQGFSAIGRFETLNARINEANSVVSLKVALQTIGLSLCADSAHTLTQLCIDLKYPLTFPDNEKYNYNEAGPVDVFQSVDPDFFNSLHIQEESRFHGDDDIVNIDDAHDWDADELSVEHSSYDSNSPKIEVQEAYLDLAQELRATPPHEDMPSIDIRFELEVERVVFKLFDGYDWKFTRKSISRTIDQVDQEIKAFGEEPSNASGQLGMTVFDSIYVSANATDTVGLKKRVNDEIQGEVRSSVYVRKANLHPSRHYKVAIQLEKVGLKFTGFALEQTQIDKDHTNPDQVNMADLSIKRFEIIDNVPTSTWNKFLTLLRHGQWPLDRPMLHLSLATFRPMSCLMATELTLNVEVAPLRLQVDQDALDFLVKFGEFKDNRFELIDEFPDIPFIQKLTTNSVKLKLDYKPKKVDYSGLRSGHASELMNFFILDGSNITLKGLELYGINGFPELNTALKAIWTPDITSKQIPGVLEGFAPMKSLLALGSGVKALVSEPSAELKEDRRLRRDLKRGCNVFVRTTTGDFVRLGAKLASGTQTVLENAEQMLGGDGSNGRIYKTEEPALDMNHLLEEDQLVGGSNPRVKGQQPAALVLDPSKGDEGEPKIVSLYADQPLDIHKGLEEAYNSLEKHMHVVYDVVWKTKGELRDNKAGAAAAAVSVAKVAPVAIIRPLIGATEAVAKALQGISNQFDKEQIDDISDKYKSLKYKR